MPLKTKEGDGNTAPDGPGVGTATARVRAERSGSVLNGGQGRVYHIFLTADDGQGGSDRVVLCCSEASLTSNWVQTELEETFAKEEKEGRPILLPLNLDGYLFEWRDPVGVEVRKRLAADFTGWETDNAKFEEQFERVVGALRAEEG